MHLLLWAMLCVKFLIYVFNILQLVHEIYNCGGIDPGAVLDVDSGGPKELCVRLGPRSSYGKVLTLYVNSILATNDFDITK